MLSFFITPALQNIEYHVKIILELESLEESIDVGEWVCLVENFYWIKWLTDEGNRKLEYDNLDITDSWKFYWIFMRINKKKSVIFA